MGGASVRPATAELVLGVGIAHSPMVVADNWGDMVRNGDAMGDGKLFDVEGHAFTHAELEQRNGARFATRARVEVWAEQYRTVRGAVAELGRAFREAEIDTVIVAGDDQFELLDRSNYPTFLVYTGSTFRMLPLARSELRRRAQRHADPQARGRADRIAEGYSMDAARELDGDPELATALVERLAADGFDVAVSSRPPSEDRGFGHAFGIVAGQLMPEDGCRMVPIVVNTYFPPNQPSASRCFDFGRSLRAAIDALASARRVAIVASGGMSHFITGEDFDRDVIAALRRGDEDALRAIPSPSLQSGTSEIRNWIIAAAACEGLEADWDEYVPVYRTPYGEGVGLAFMRWSR
jgi:Catalytic LigB subunit of aromatic ring-opening dioxygenase